MRSLLRTLLLAAFLLPASAQMLRPVVEVCAESREAASGCCESEQGCAASCVECPCCAAGAVTLASPVLGGVPEVPPAAVVLVHAAFPPAAPRAEILHVPRSVERA